MDEQRAYRLTIALALALTSGQLLSSSAQQGTELPSPREPKRAQITSVEQLLPNARLIIKRERKIADGIIGAGVKPGEKILILADSSWDPLVVEALCIAIKEVGAEVNVISQGGFPTGESPHWEKDPAELMRRGFSRQSVAGWVAQAVRDSDAVIGLFARGATVGRIGKTRTIRWEYPTARQLAGADIGYPEELLKAISYKVWEQLKGAKKIRITDVLGTDITFTLDDKYWEWMAQEWGKSWWGETDLENPLPHELHLTVIPSAATKPDARGVIVTRALHSGPIPEMKIYFENGQVTKIEGGGKAGEYMREALEKFKDTLYPDYPGPGVGWLEEVSLGTHPKAAQPYSYEEYEKMQRYPGWSSGRRRSGVIHMAFGTNMHGGHTRDDYYKKAELPVNHRDIELYFPTYYVDGRVIVEKGHLLALDDPEIRRIAAKYGNPDELLREDWIPKLGK